MKTCEQIFNDAAAAFVPVADDNPECVPFYRRWFGAMAVLESLGFDKKSALNDHHSMFHYACCQSTNYAEFLVSLRSSLPRPVRAPEMRCNYDPQPAEATEADARQIFDDSFRTAFKGKRLNSKFAAQKWEEKKARALEIARERREENFKVWKIRNDAINRENAEKMTKYRGEVQYVLDAEKMVKCIEEGRHVNQAEVRTDTGLGVLR